MLYEFCTQTDPGLARHNNEDAVAYDPSTRLCILADGMGGYNAGEVASGMAVAFIDFELSRWLAQAGKDASAGKVRRAMKIWVDKANRSVFNTANTNPLYAGMGTTLVVGVFQANRLVIGHIGDSRCYRLRGQVFQQITKDHSWVQAQLDAGLITAQQALTSAHKNLVTRALGVTNTVLLEVNEHRVKSGDIYLMCSDGLSDMLLDAGIASILSSHGTLREKAERLVIAAKEGGGRDNISVVLAHAVEDTRKKAFYPDCWESNMLPA